MANWLGVAATRAAWEAKVETSSQRLMLLAIARYADDNGKAFPSVDTICEDTCLSKNTAFKVLKELRCLGLVSVEKRQNNANQYTVSVDFSDDSYTKSGTTKIGTTNIGTTKIDTTSTTNIGMTVVPKLVQEEKQEESKEENIFCDTASFESVSQSAALEHGTKKEHARPSKSCPIKKPEGVTDEDWADYKRLRKEKRLPLTSKGLSLLQSEAKKAGKTVSEVIDICLENSWAGFKAEWIKGEKAQKTENIFAADSPFKVHTVVQTPAPAKREREFNGETGDLLGGLL